MGHRVQWRKQGHAFVPITPLALSRAQMWSHPKPWICPTDGDVQVLPPQHLHGLALPDVLCPQCSLSRELRVSSPVQHFRKVRSKKIRPKVMQGQERQWRLAKLSLALCTTQLFLAPYTQHPWASHISSLLLQCRHTCTHAHTRNLASVSAPTHWGIFPMTPQFRVVPALFPKGSFEEGQVCLGLNLPPGPWPSAPSQGNEFHLLLSAHSEISPGALVSTL